MKGFTRLLASCIVGLGLVRSHLGPFDKLWNTPSLTSVPSLAVHAGFGSAFSRTSSQAIGREHRSLRSPHTTKYYSHSYTQEDIPHRKLPAEYPGLDDPEAVAGLLFIIILIFLFCCCRGMLCDLLACVCIYEMCCDDGAVGGFDLMPI